jgi:hypothetical protein
LGFLGFGFDNDFEKKLRVEEACFHNLDAVVGGSCTIEDGQSCLLEQALQTKHPHTRQWCRGQVNLENIVLQQIQTSLSESSIQ